MIKLGLSIYDDDKEEDADLPPLEEDAPAGDDQATKMEEVV